jgi:hypothetical protein
VSKADYQTRTCVATCPRT